MKQSEKDRKSDHEQPSAISHQKQYDKLKKFKTDASNLSHWRPLNMDIQLSVSNLSIRNAPPGNFILKVFYLNPNKEDIPFFRQCRRLVQVCPCSNDNDLSPNSFEYQPTIDSIQRIICQGYLYKPSLLFCLYDIDDINKDSAIHVGYVKQHMEISNQHCHRYILPFLKPNGKTTMEESVELEFDLSCTFPLSLVEMYYSNVNRMHKLLHKSQQRNEKTPLKLHMSNKDLYAQALQRHQESSQRKFKQEQYRINCENARLQQRLKNITLGKKST